MTRSYLGAYWSSRAQSIDECVEAVGVFLDSISGLSPHYSGWRLRPKYVSADSAVATTDATFSILDTLKHGRIVRDADGEVIEELGYSAALWNGADCADNSVSLSIQMAVTSQWVPNSIVLQLPDDNAVPELYGYDKSLSALMSAVSAFVPDYCLWTSSYLTDRQAEPDRVFDDGSCVLGELTGVPAGWATFLTDGRSPQFDRSQLPEDAKAIRVEHGTVVVVGDDPARPSIDDVLQVRCAMGYEVVK